MKGPPADPSESPAGETTVRTGCDWAQTSPMVAVLETVPDAESVQPTDLPSLHSSVDPDALNALVERTSPGPNGAGIRVEFSYASRRVAVESDAGVVVTPLQEVD